jgi:hypothetical protein
METLTIVDLTFIVRAISRRVKILEACIKTPAIVEEAESLLKSLDVFEQRLKDLVFENNNLNF